MNKQLEYVLKFIILLIVLSFVTNILTLLTIKNVNDSIKELKQIRYYTAEFTGEVPDLPNLPYWPFFNDDSLTLYRGFSFAYSLFTNGFTTQTAYAIIDFVLDKREVATNEPRKKISLFTTQQL